MSPSTTRVTTALVRPADGGLADGCDGVGLHEGVHPVPDPSGRLPRCGVTASLETLGEGDVPLSVQPTPATTSTIASIAARRVNERGILDRSIGFGIDVPARVLETVSEHPFGPSGYRVTPPPYLGPCSETSPPLRHP